MSMVTTRRGGPKPFAWSYSRLKNFESCPKRHWHIDIQKDVKEEESEQLKWGEIVHKAAAARCGPKRVPLPDNLVKLLEPWCERVTKGDGDIKTEQKLAITADFGACGFFDKDVWFRSIGDVIKINGPVALLADWKTGKVIEDSQQLALGAACVFAAYPDVRVVRAVFIWLKEDAESSAVFKREDMPAMWKGVWPRVSMLEQAHNLQSYPAKPGRLCRSWCPVTQCPHHGE